MREERRKEKGRTGKRERRREKKREREVPTVYALLFRARVLWPSPFSCFGQAFLRRNVNR